MVKIFYKSNMPTVGKISLAVILSVVLVMGVDESRDAFISRLPVGLFSQSEGMTSVQMALRQQID